MRRIITREVKSLARRQMQAAARRVIRHHRPKIVGITGSVGKTTTKEMIAAVLMHPDARPYVGTVGKAERSLNNNSGLPLSVLRHGTHPRTLRQWAAWIVRAPLEARRLARSRYPDVLVLEYALGPNGDVGRLARLAPPTVAVVTAVGPAHLETWGTVERIAQEKARLIHDVPPSGLVILGSHNPFTAAMGEQTRAPVTYVAGRGRDLAENAARAVGRHFGVPDEVIERALLAAGRIAGRQDAFELALPDAGTVTIVDDSFNANPLSVELALDLLAARPAAGRRIAALGSMLELGRESAAYHAAIGAYARARVDLLIGVGDDARGYDAHEWFATSADCAAALPAQLRDGDVVLVKGSRSIDMKTVVRALRNLAVRTAASAAGE